MDQILSERIAQRIASEGYAHGDEEVKNMTDYILVMLDNGKDISNINNSLSDLIGESYNPAFGSWMVEQVGIAQTPAPTREEAVSEQIDMAPAEMSGKSVTRRNKFNKVAPYQNRKNFQDRISNAGRNKKDSTPTVRCKHWRYCTLSTCNFAHPVEPCKKFEHNNCTYAPGKCPRLHLGQDISPEHLEAFLTSRLPSGQPNPKIVDISGERRRAEALEKGLDFEYPASIQKKLYPPKSSGRVNMDPIITAETPICKFGDSCKNARCTSAHSTPAAAPGTGVVLTLEGCPQGRKCQNPDCVLGHPTPAKTSLESMPLPICRFYPICLDKQCVFSHPTKKIPCNYGAACKNSLCVYTHPASRELSLSDAGLNAQSMIQCRYYPNCRNSECQFWHPEVHKNKVWVSGASDTVMSQ